MLLRLLKFVEYVWVGMGFLCAYQLFMTWNTEGNMRYIFAGGLVVSIFMFFFRRYTRRRYEQIQAEKEAKGNAPAKEQD